MDKKSLSAAETIFNYVENGLEPADVAKTVFEAIEADHFYILTHPPFSKFIKQRLEAISNKTQPRSTW
jgi:hypothetical protein